MAFTNKVVLENGLIIEDAYIRLDTVNGYKGRLDISVNSYVSQSDFQIGKGYLVQKIYNFMPSVADGASNFIKQGYDYLKTLEEYETSVDC